MPAARPHHAPATAPRPFDEMLLTHFTFFFLLRFLIKIVNTEEQVVEWEVYSWVAQLGPKLRAPHCGCSLGSGKQYRKPGSPPGPDLIEQGCSLGPRRWGGIRGVSWVLPRSSQCWGQTALGSAMAMSCWEECVLGEPCRPGHSKQGSLRGSLR